MSKFEIEKILTKADGEYVPKEEVCTNCPKNTGDCEFWKNCSRAYILGKRARDRLEEDK